VTATPRPVRALWSALHYPALPLERLALDEGEARAHVVTHQQGSQRLVMQADARAVALGVRSGLTLSGARAIAPALIAIEHDPDTVATRLDQLSIGAYRYSSRVVLSAPDTVLIEIGASLRLFGGLGALLTRIRADAAAERTHLVIGTAPTASAARLLARVADERPVRTAVALTAALAPLPIESLPLEARAANGLRRSGVRTIDQLCAIAPASLSRRFGHALVDTLYRLDGRLPDPQVPVIVPPSFAQTVELPLEATSTGALSFALRRLISALAGFLRARDLGAGALVLVLRHRRRAPTRVRLRFTEPTSDQAHLGRTADERLARTALAEPVTHLSLESDLLAAVERDAITLLDAAGPRRTSRAEVVDALVARFGRERVYTVFARDEHRPEHSWGKSSDTAVSGPAGWPARPLWLLDSPVPATTPLEIVSVPERIETGWWEPASDTRRDYFIARDPDGTYYWVFRHRDDMTSPVWVHGLFS